MDVHKVTLSTKKVVLIKDIELRDEELAAQAAAKKAGQNGNMVAVGYGMQNELLRLLIQEVDGKKISPTERELLGSKESVLTYREFAQVRKFLEKLMGEEVAEPQSEYVVSGS